MEQDNSRNTMLFVVCAVAILIVYQFFIMAPAEKRRAEEARQHAAVAAAKAAWAAVREQARQLPALDAALAKAEAFFADDSADPVKTMAAVGGLAPADVHVAGVRRQGSELHRVGGQFVQGERQGGGGPVRVCVSLDALHAVYRKRRRLAVADSASASHRQRDRLLEPIHER